MDQQESGLPKNKASFLLVIVGLLVFGVVSQVMPIEGKTHASHVKPMTDIFREKISNDYLLTSFQVHDGEIKASFSRDGQCGDNALNIKTVADKRLSVFVKFDDAGHKVFPSVSMLSGSDISPTSAIDGFNQAIKDFSDYCSALKSREKEWQQYLQME